MKLILHTFPIYINRIIISPWLFMTERKAIFIEGIKSNAWVRSCVRREARITKGHFVQVETKEREEGQHVWKLLSIFCALYLWNRIYDISLIKVMIFQQQGLAFRVVINLFIPIFIFRGRHSAKLIRWWLLSELHSKGESCWNIVKDCRKVVNCILCAKCKS